MIPTYSSDQFTYHVNKSTGGRSFTTEVSSLGFRAGEAPPKWFDLISERTGNKLRFFRTLPTYNSDGELVAFCYYSSVNPRQDQKLTGINLYMLND